MGQIITKQSEIPEAPYYVLANDSFMSGWGPAAGKTNTVILPCRSYEEAEVVAANARARSDMRRVRIAYLPPKLSKRNIYSLMDRETAGRWYTPGAFAKTKGGKARSSGPRPQSGYAYRYEQDNDWRGSSDELWDTVRYTPTGNEKLLGERYIDGSRVRVFRTDDGWFIAQTTVATGGKRRRTRAGGKHRHASGEALIKAARDLRDVWR